MGNDKAPGICIKGPASVPPYSRTKTECLPSSDNRAAIAEPADPDPMITKSASIMPPSLKINLTYFCLRASETKVILK